MCYIESNTYGVQISSGACGDGGEDLEGGEIEKLISEQEREDVYLAQETK